MTARAPVLRQAPRWQARTAPSFGPPGQPIKIGTIYFVDNSKALRRDDLTILRQVAEVQRRTGKIIRIVGHASGRVRTFDPARRARINFEVSLNRAKSIAAALAGMGVPADRIQAEGAGDTLPIYAEYTAAGEAANRRAELFMLN
jgi:outer membrane protein OmpA-like peptidoglycan-associated protein